ncbi:exosortase F system-associated protein [Gillisia sp. M10.2A]|uniref:Exosortase F system-associated protein n=1 Tax=Gillisia lutea TaxID=2909668 RepID=A0ABS9EHE9_9FLAO|nr:exosortase F system-associated protein [Gillisia lutea]MCF4100878.1 exosortase F system-associated protein [Gillisia lutea]
MKARYRVIGIGGLVVLLALIRFYEHQLFYDPFLSFYEDDYLRGKIPQFATFKLILNVVFRFWLNTSVCLAIIYVAFLSRNIVKFSLVLYAILFLICLTLFIFFISNTSDMHYQTLFYVRRFLIHPIFVIILLPAFYYYRLKKRQSSKFKSIS